MKFWLLFRGSTHQDSSIDISFSTLDLMSKKPWRLLFQGGTDRQTDTDLESSCGNMSATKIFQLKAQKFELATDSNMHPQVWGCIIIMEVEYLYSVLHCYSIYWKWPIAFFYWMIGLGSQVFMILNCYCFSLIIFITHKLWVINMMISHSQHIKN